MKLNLKSTIAAPADHKSGQRALNGIIGNTRRGIVVDKTLDPDSNNPVANKPVSTALAALAGKIDAALQKPTGLTKTKLVGVGASGQENIEIGDNLTLENGKLSATGGGSNVNILTASSLEQVDNTYQGTYSGVPDESKINILHIPDFADFVVTCIMDGSYFGYINFEDINVNIFLSEGEYIVSMSQSSINIITTSDKDNTFKGTLVSPGLTLFSVKVPDQSFYITLPVSSLGLYGTALSVNDDNGELTVYTFYEYNKSYTTVKYHLKHYSHFITMTDSISNVALYLTINNSSRDTFTANTLASYLAGKKVLANGNLHGVVPTYIAGEGDVIKVYYRTPGDSNINPTPDEYQDLSSFTISDLVTPVD